ncbi:hypothetical protein FZEAL_6000 [Fusarium zealandicum]|uniref:Large ribosomal subunit protein eL39 n=1 Tax=Fusarium zealandicum TaxID=1053134 RepID=A0A8H4XJ90_9HYPO|nr:hypothetical protein FZEAL_6000 [Fusarium zealandicum]
MFKRHVHYYEGFHALLTARGPKFLDALNLFENNRSPPATDRLDHQRRQDADALLSVDDERRCVACAESLVRRSLTHLVPLHQSHKSFRTKQKLAKAQKQNRPVPQWIRLRTGNAIRYNAKRRHWRKTSLNI